MHRVFVFASFQASRTFLMVNFSRMSFLVSHRSDYATGNFLPTLTNAIGILVRKYHNMHISIARRGVCFFFFFRLHSVCLLFTYLMRNIHTLCRFVFFWIESFRMPRNRPSFNKQSYLCACIEPSHSMNTHK